MIEVKNSRRARIYLAVFTLVLCLLSMAMLFLSLALFRTQSSFLGFGPTETLVYGIGGAVLSVFFVWACKQSYFAGQQYQISPVGIRFITPTVTDRYGKWEDLVFVSPLLGTLGFRDGTMIQADLLWRLLTDKQRQEVLEYSGEDGLLGTTVGRHEQWYSEPFPRSLFAIYQFGRLLLVLGLLGLVIAWIVDPDGLSILTDDEERRDGKLTYVAWAIVPPGVGFEIMLITRYLPYFKRTLEDQRAKRAFRAEYKDSN